MQADDVNDLETATASNDQEEIDENLLDQVFF
jgi:hypothetical protein